MKPSILFLFMALFGTISATAADAPKADASKNETIVLGGGCFWCLEASFELVPGVKSVVNGYAGGHTVNPSYEQVCSHDTGHAEVVRIEYNPAEVSLDALLNYFWMIHDPTSLNRQGNDEGPQYRSIILYANDAQKEAALKSKAAAQARYSDPITTEIVPLKAFYEAEEYHQDYFKKNPYQGYCQAVVKAEGGEDEESAEGRRALRSGKRFRTRRACPAPYREDRRHPRVALFVLKRARWRVDWPPSARDNSAALHSGDARNLVAHA